MPQLFNFYEELLNVDWSVIAIYTCSKSCDFNNSPNRTEEEGEFEAYFEEACFV